MAIIFWVAHPVGTKQLHTDIKRPGGPPKRCHEYANQESGQRMAHPESERKHLWSAMFSIRWLSLHWSFIICLLQLSATWPYGIVLPCVGLKPQNDVASLLYLLEVLVLLTQAVGPVRHPTHEYMCASSAFTRLAACFMLNPGWLLLYLSQQSILKQGVHRL